MAAQLLQRVEARPLGFAQPCPSRGELSLRPQEIRFGQQAALAPAHKGIVRRTRGVLGRSRRIQPSLSGLRAVIEQPRPEHGRLAHPERAPARRLGLATRRAAAGPKRGVDYAPADGHGRRPVADRRWVVERLHLKVVRTESRLPELGAEGEYRIDRAGVAALQAELWPERRSGAQTLTRRDIALRFGHGELGVPGQRALDRLAQREVLQRRSGGARRALGLSGGACEEAEKSERNGPTDELIPKSGCIAHDDLATAHSDECSQSRAAPGDRRSDRRRSRRRGAGLGSLCRASG